MHDFTLLIIDWYRQNARSLPWRDTNNPYFIWLSEVILQQTRVDQGMSYYYKFIHNYPTVMDLANADEQMVLKDWQGLGYYSRARNLHRAAQYIRDEYKGIFPSDYDNIRALKGVGDYTAAAIASFAFQLPHAVVDGNVYRLLSRYFNEDTPIDTIAGKKLFKALAQEFMPQNDPASYNQALMEMGALICKPKNPNCDDCPLHLSCQALRANSIAGLPVKSKTTKTRKRYFNYLIPAQSDVFFIQQRTEKDIWAKMYEPALVETENEVDQGVLQGVIKELVEGRIASEPLAEYKHVLSHQVIHAKFWSIENAELKQKNDIQTINSEQLQNLPIPRLFDRFLKGE